jgi:hypothetical protein
MTTLEMSQHRDIFIRAGRTAFLMMIPLDNPYKEQPWKSLWERGHKQAKKRFYDKRRTNENMEIK